MKTASNLYVTGLVFSVLCACYNSGPRGYTTESATSIPSAADSLKYSDMTENPETRPRIVEEAPPPLPDLTPIPMVEVDPGPLPPERSEGAVRAVMRRYSASILPCSFVLRDQPDLSGLVILSVEVTPAGRVAGTTVIDNTTGNRDLSRCLADAAGIWRFEPVDEGISRSVVVSLPFRMNGD